MANRYRILSSTLGRVTVRHWCQPQSAIGQHGRHPIALLRPLPFSAITATSDRKAEPSSPLLSFVRNNKTWFLTLKADELLTKKNLFKIPREEWVLVCQELGLDAGADDPPSKLRNRVRNTRNVLVKSHPSRQDYEDAQAKERLKSEEERELYDSYSHIELIHICRVYGVPTRGKDRVQKVRALFKKKQVTSPEAVEIMEKYDKLLLHYCKQLGFRIASGGKRKSCKLNLARKLVKIQKINLKIHEKLAAKHAPLESDLSMEGVTDFKEQLFFYRDRKKQKMIFEKLGASSGGRKFKCYQALYRFCRIMKIDFRKF